MNFHGGLTEDELKTVAFHKTALSLLLNEEGKVTPHGVVYDNGMKLELYYDGLCFPDYRYSGGTLLTVAVTDRNLPESTMEIAWPYLPSEKCQINRALLRAGIQAEDMCLRIDECELSDALADMPEIEEDLFQINKLCACVQRLGHEAYPKLEAALQLARPSGITEARHLIEQLDLFNFIPGVSTLEEYGQHMITKSGHFKYDDTLYEFYDYNKYDQWRMTHEQGQFVDGGYASYST